MYGYDSLSWRRSGEKRQLDKERREFTEKYQIKPESILVDLVCTCRSFENPHGLEAHLKLASDYDWSLPHSRWERI
jgi:hypothetical protein